MFSHSAGRLLVAVLALLLLFAAVFAWSASAQETGEPAVGPSGLTDIGQPTPPSSGAPPDRTASDLPVGITNEPTIAINPLDASNIAVADLFFSRVSTDNGASFSAPVLAPVPVTHVQAGDPSLAFDSQGRLFWTYLGRRTDNNLWDVFMSQLNPATGAIVSGPINVSAGAGLPASAGNSNDKEWLTADRTPGSPFQDRLYVVWSQLLTIHATFSSDQGLTWSPALTLSAGTEGFVWPVHNAVAANGDVYIAYHSQTGFVGGAPDGTSGQVFVLRSTDGGVTFPQKTVAYAAGEADITFNVQDVPARQLNQSASWTQGSAQPWILPDPTDSTSVYVVAADDPTNAAHGGANDDMAVYIARSADSGATWGAPVQVDDGPGNSHQFFPTAAIDESSRCLSVTWYDSRNGAKNGGGNLLLDLYMRSSPDGGLNFGPEIRLSDVVFDPDLGASERFAGPPPTLRIGEYNGVAVAHGTAHAVWTGNTATGQQALLDSASACGDVGGIAKLPDIGSRVSLQTGASTISAAALAAGIAGAVLVASLTLGSTAWFLRRRTFGGG